jgi:hypothetical protein
MKELDEGADLPLEISNPAQQSNALPESGDRYIGYVFASRGAQ